MKMSAIHTIAHPAFAVVSLCACLFVPRLEAQPAVRPTEHQVKAAYIYNFAKFVEWPSSAALGAGICVVGEDPVGAALQAVVSADSTERTRISVKRVLRPRDAVAARCRVLFIPAAEEGQWKEIEAAIDKLPILTVSDGLHFARRGGMIQFVLDDNRVRFEVNLAASAHVGLTLSSELLKLAVAVRRGP